jgi:hypothetical protein
MKRLGPEIKLPKLRGRKPKASKPGASSQLKAPQFAQDVYYDLRDRRLLPLVALVIVAIAAVPFLLGDSEEAVPPPTSATTETTELEVNGKPTLTVVQAKPGLRDYRKRLRGRTANDPFKQKYTGLPGSAELQSTVETTPTGSGGDDTDVSVTDEGDSVTVEVDEDGSSPGSAPPSGSTPPGGGPPSRGGSAESGDGDDLRFFAYRPDVRFGVAGGEGELKLYRELPIASLLPKANPVVMFLGITEDGKRAVFDVSQEVIMVRGGGKCIGGDQSCGLLFMRVGEAATLLTMTTGRTFRLALDAIEFVPVDRPPPARSSSTRDEQQIPRFSGYAAVGQFQN